MKTLSFDQKRLLALYLELYKDYYCYDDEKYNDSFNITKNEGKMEAMCYLFKELNLFSSDYGFSMNHYIPYSPLLLSLIYDIYRKDDQVDKFYSEYYEKRVNDSLGIYSSLGDYYSSLEIRKINKVNYVLNNLKDVNLGIELMASMHYIMKYNYACSLSFGELENRLYDKYFIYRNRDGLCEESFKVLHILDLLDVKQEKLPQKVKYYER